MASAVKIFRGILAACVLAASFAAIGHPIMMQMMGAPPATGGGAVTIGWDPDADYGAGDGWAAQVDLGDWSIESKALSVPVTTPSSWSCSSMSLWVYIEESNATGAHDVRGAILNSTGTKLTNGDTANRDDVTNAYAWQEFTVPTVPTMSASTDYWITIAASGGAGTVNVRGGKTNGDCTNPPVGVTSCASPEDSALTNLPPSAIDSTIAITGNLGRTAGIYLECTP